VGDASSLSGGAVLSNGEIALIVDCDALADACGAATASSTDLPNAA
jgi:chemotaxis protein histidine kinase CheA